MGVWPVKIQQQLDERDDMAIMVGVWQCEECGREGRGVTVFPDWMAYPPPHMYCCDKLQPVRLDDDTFRYQSRREADSGFETKSQSQVERILQKECRGKVSRGLMNQVQVDSVLNARTDYDATWIGICRCVRCGHRFSSVQGVDASRIDCHAVKCPSCSESTSIFEQRFSARIPSAVEDPAYEYTIDTPEAPA